MSKTVLRVQLLSLTAEPEITTALGGRLCYSDSDVGSLREAVAGKAEAFLDKLTGFGHLSPIEHASFTFGIEGVSRALLAQITRHRLASFSVQSQRYVKQSDFSYIVPPSIEALGEEEAALYRQQMEMIQHCYDHWLEKGIPGEDARFVLPNAAETRMLLTMNARELLHFFSLRCCSRAQWEIRALAWCMLGIVLREAPALFQKGGPGCTADRCSEGKMSCGKVEAVRGFSTALREFAATRPTDGEIVAFVLAHYQDI